VALGAATCAPPTAGVGAVPSTETTEPEIRVGLVSSGDTASVGGGGALLFGGPDGAGLSELPSGTEATLVGGADGVRLRLGAIETTPARTLSIRARDQGGTVRVGGREYRGEVLVAQAEAGLLVVNAVSLEEYLAGVVSAEMGRRPDVDREAMYAQAVISRTVAVRSLGRYRVRGYDLMGTVADQAYAGVGTESDLAWEAVRATRGQVVTYGGAVIEAFFHSTCGGRTEAVEDAFSGGPQRYLSSISDRDPSGQAYCRLSPRFEWNERWSGAQLARGLRESGIRSDGPPSDLAVEGLTGSGRVGAIRAVVGGRGVVVRGQNEIRRVLRRDGGGILWSTRFRLQVSRSGGKVVEVSASGGGNGHGVGLCQWGAIGRARAGADYREILSAYFPGTEIRRFY